MKKIIKNGFTLIELLAITIILGVILLVAIPNVLNVIENVKKQAWSEYVYGVVHAGTLFYAHDMNPTEFAYSGNTEYNADGKVLLHSGQKPDSGNMVINSNGTIAIAFHNGTYCATKAANETIITITTNAPSNCLATNLIPLGGEDFDTVVISSTGSYTSGTGDPQTDSFSKDYYSLGYVADSASFPYNYTYSIDLGVLPLDISEITSVSVKTKTVFETLSDFRSYIIKRNMGEVIWVGEEPTEIDIDMASTFQEHAARASNITINNVAVTCNASKCTANINIAVNNITGVDTHNINGKEVAYLPLKFNVEFNGEETLVCDYGTSIPVSITNLYSSWSRTTPLTRAVAPYNVQIDNNYNGNFQWVHTILNDTIEEEHLFGDVTNFGNIISGANTYNLSSISSSSRWLGVWIQASYYTFSASFGALSLVFDDNQEYTIANAVANGYIEPLVVYASSYTYNGTPYIWTNMSGTLTGGSTNLNSFPSAFYYFKTKGHGLKAVKMTANKAYYAQQDGLRVIQWSQGIELSLSPIN